MRNINSQTYFDQMKGRGCRVIQPDALQSVTPDARAKDRFVIVDAVGVCRGNKSTSKPLDRKPSVPLDKLLAFVASGGADFDVVMAVGAKLSRLSRLIDEEHHLAIQEASGGITLQELAKGLLSTVDPDTCAGIAKDKFGLKDDQEPTEEQIGQVQQEQSAIVLKPFHDPKLRGAILAAKQSLDQVIDEATPDELLKAGFTNDAVDKARSIVNDFRKFIEDNKTEIEALQVLYSVPYRAGLRFAHVKELARKLNQPPFHVDPNRPESLVRLWQAYEVVEPEKVRGKGGRQLVDVIALVRHAMDPNTLLAPVGLTVEERYQKWMADKAAVGVTFTPDQRKWLDAIKDHIASSLNIEQEDLEEVPFNTIGGLGRAYELFGDNLTAIINELNTRLAA